MLSGAVRGSEAGIASFLEQDLNKELLRFTTAGSVDDGKSTLIGRLLHDSKAVYEDQLASVKKSGINRSTGPLDFSLLTDGLRAEREQGITIDVAYRYFATPRRKFIIADTPGHEQYTRNMATGASTADLAIILIDATQGLRPQTKRHAFIAWLLGIPSVVAAVNKMDLVDYQEDVYRNLQEEFSALARQMGIPHVQCIPISALVGDNIVSRSQAMPWYPGPALLEHLETVPVHRATRTEAVRFPVQMVIRPDAGFRGFAGQVASGIIRPGDPVVALPSGQKTRVQAIVTFDGELPAAFPPQSVTLRLEDEIDLSRGDMLVAPANPPRVSRHFEAMVVWLHSKPLELGRTYLIKHTVRMARAKAIRIRHRVDINTLAEESTRLLEMNDIASVEFEATTPLYFDPYLENHTTGSFILIDPISNATVGAAMIRADLGAVEEIQEFPETLRQEPVTAEDRYERNGHYPAVILAGNRHGLAQLLERTLFEWDFQVLHLAAGALQGNALPDFFRAAHAAGLIVIISGESQDASAKDELGALFGDRLFDFRTMDLPVEDEEAAWKVLGCAASLRISSAAESGDSVR